MGRIRKALHWLTAPGGAPGAPGLVRYESSAETAQREQTELLRTIASQQQVGHPISAANPSPIPLCSGCSRMTTCGHAKSCPWYCVRSPTLQRGNRVYYRHANDNCGEACRRRFPKGEHTPYTKVTE